MQYDKIHPCLWFDNNAKEAAMFYCSIFKNSQITADTPLVVTFNLNGKNIMGLNGGPYFTINPSISLFVSCETYEEIETIWNKLSEGGSALMALGQYPWSEKYGWVKDKFGLTWQLMHNAEVEGQTINPLFLFSDKQYGNAEEAINHYTSIFDHSSIQYLEHYEAGEAQVEGKLKFGSFTLFDLPFAAMDGPGDHEFSFNEGVSLVVDCDTQEEINYYWDKLTEGGSEVQCGWLKDKFGVSWQIVPVIMGELMSDPEKAPRVTEAFMKMKKLDIETLMKA